MGLPFRVRVWKVQGLDSFLNEGLVFRASGVIWLRVYIGSLGLIRPKLEGLTVFVFWPFKSAAHQIPKVSKRLQGLSFRAYGLNLQTPKP